MAGAKTAGSNTLETTTAKFTAPKDQVPTMAAPIKPPKSACEELEGNPRSHVNRFHNTAPIKPAKIIPGVMATPLGPPSLMMPPEMVLATSVERKAPTKFKIAASATAVLGLMAPVAMGVAMALAVS